MALSRDDVYLGAPERRWQYPQQVDPTTWVCGFCGDKVSSKDGWRVGDTPDGSGGTSIAWVRICPSCQGTTLFTPNGKRFPSDAPGGPVPYVPDDVSKLYEEARHSAAAGAYTASVLTCRKILMHVAVEKEAKPGESFVAYVEHLAKKGFITPDGKGWVDYIRVRGNEANHEIALMDESDAIALITFVEMLLRNIYEFPKKVPVPPTTSANAPSPSS